MPTLNTHLIFVEPMEAVLLGALQYMLCRVSNSMACVCLACCMFTFMYSLWMVCFVYRHNYRKMMIMIICVVVVGMLKVKLIQLQVLRKFIIFTV